MRKIVLSLAAGVASLALTSAPASAHEPHRGREPAVRSYYREHGHAFKGGYYYVGRDHHHWTRRVWDPVHCRYNYWDPSVCCYYYWYAPANCYYPVSYCP
jgi:hypothetical protein